MFQFTSLPFRLAISPHDCKRSKANGPDKGNQTSPVPGRLAHQGPVSERSISGKPDSVFRVDNQEKSELKPTQVFSFVGYEYHLDSTLVKPTQERWLKLQDLILQLKSKHVEDHDLMPSLPDNLKSQTHSRVSECDGRPSVQVEPNPVNRMVTASAGVQTDLSKVVHSSCRSPVPDQNAWDIDALNINWSGLTDYACDPSTGQFDSAFSSTW